MKILYVVSTLRACGPTNQLFYIIKNLDRTKFEPIVLTLSPEPQNSMWSKFTKLNIALHSLKLNRWQGLLLGANKLKSFVARQQPDIIHSQGLRPDSLAANCLPDYPTVATIRNYPYDDYVMKFGKVVGTYSAKQHINAFKKVNCAVACSNTISNLLEQHGVKSKVICNGVDSDFYTPNYSKDSDISQLKQKLDLPLDSKIVVSVGALIARKQPEMIVKGFLASQAAQNANTLLLMIGEGNLSESCQAIANTSASSSQIKFIGQINNVVDYLRVADCMISAPVSEALPNSVIEALACGVPVCLSDIKPHQEILDLNPEAGVIFPVNNVAALANELDKLLGTPSERMSIAAREIIDKHLNARTMSAQYQEIYLALNR